MKFDDTLAGHVQRVCDCLPGVSFLAGLLDELWAVLPCGSDVSEFIECAHALMVTEFTYRAQVSVSSFMPSGVNMFGGAMALVTGRVHDFLFGLMTARQPIIRFHPTSKRGSISLRNDQIMPHRPVDATITAADWEINIVPSMGGTTPDMWFRVEIIELDPEGNFTNSWWWPNEVHIPPDGGVFAELPGAPMSSESVWVGLTPPPNGWLGWWLYSPAEGEEMPLDDPRIGDLIQGPGPFILTT